LKKCSVIFSFPVVNVSWRWRKDVWARSVALYR
jgi:hypothetical protein